MPFELQVAQLFEMGFEDAESASAALQKVEDAMRQCPCVSACVKNKILRFLSATFRVFYFDLVCQASPSILSFCQLKICDDFRQMENWTLLWNCFSS